MKSLTFALILIMSISVYAKTEAGLIQPGFETSRQKREIAASAKSVNDGIVALAKFNKVSNDPSRYNSLGYVASPENKSGAFTRADADKLKAKKKKAAPTAASLNSNK